MHRGNFLSASVLLATVFSSGLAYADGPADLRSALTRLQGTSPIKAVIEAKTWVRRGEGKEAEETQGSASVALEDNGRGLQVLYGKDLLARLDNEERAREKDSKAKAPLTATMREFSSGELRSMCGAASALSRRLEKASFRAEKADQLNGKNVRMLSYEMPLEKLDEQSRKYVKNYQGHLDIWIDADGTPLASRWSEAASGRAFVVISFESKEDESLTYSVSGDRLFISKKEFKAQSSGAGERSESRTSKTMQVQS